MRSSPSKGIRSAAKRIQPTPGMQRTGSSSTDQITSDQTLALSGTAEIGSLVTITRVGVGIIGTATADGSGNWSFDYSGTTLAALQSIRAASREIETFNGVCGAESGWVPVSASAPSLLLEKIEVEKAFIPPDRPPVLGPPSMRTGGGQ